MTSTFTNNVNLQLMATGDQSNAWGSVLNSSVFANIDQALGGTFSANVAGSSDYALSQANAQNFEHILTGVLTGSISYVIPLINSAAPGRYISVVNNTSGNFTVTVKQSGGTGIIVPQGQTRFLKLSASSTTTVDPFTNLSSLNLGIPSSVSGTLGFYNGSNANIAALKAGVMGSSVTWTLPTGDGTNGQSIITNGTGALSWSTPSMGITTAGLTMPTEFSVAGSPLTGNGTFAITKANQNPNLIYASPTSGTSVPTFRSLVIGDLPSLSSITNTLSGDVTMTNSSQYYDGPTIAQGTSGTWLVIATITLDNSSNCSYSVKLWDGTTIFASCKMGMTTSAGSGNDTVATLAAIVTSPAANLKISASCSTTGGTIKANASSNSKDSQIQAFRIVA